MADFERIFPYDSYGKDRAHHFGPFWEQDFGAMSGGNCSPGPFVLLLISNLARLILHLFSRKRAEYCFESTVSEERTH